MTNEDKIQDYLLNCNCEVIEALTNKETYLRKLFSFKDLQVILLYLHEKENESDDEILNEIIENESN